MMKKLDTMMTLGLGNTIWTIEFLRNPNKCLEKLGSREELKSKILAAMEIKYEE